MKKDQKEVRVVNTCPQFYNPTIWEAEAAGSAVKACLRRTNLRGQGWTTV